MELMALKRFESDLKELLQLSPTLISVGQEDPHSGECQAILLGPLNTPFEGGLFELTITVPSDYPFHPPKVAFKTPILHPNINKKGDLFLEILEATNWSPALTIGDVLVLVCAMLTDPDIFELHPSDVTDMYTSDRVRYENAARIVTEEQYSSEPCFMLESKK